MMCEFGLAIGHILPIRFMGCEYVFELMLLL